MGQCACMVPCCVCVLRKGLTKINAQCTSTESPRISTENKPNRSSCKHSRQTKCIKGCSTGRIRQAPRSSKEEDPTFNILPSPKLTWQKQVGRLNLLRELYKLDPEIEDTAEQRGVREEWTFWAVQGRAAARGGRERTFMGVLHTLDPLGWAGGEGLHRTQALSLRTGWGRAWHA